MNVLEPNAIPNMPLLDMTLVFPGREPRICPTFVRSRFVQLFWAENLSNFSGLVSRNQAANHFLAPLFQLRQQICDAGHRFVETTNKNVWINGGGFKIYCILLPAKRLETDLASSVDSCNQISKTCENWDRSRVTSHQDFNSIPTSGENL